MIAAHARPRAGRIIRCDGHDGRSTGCRKIASGLERVLEPGREHARDDRLALRRLDASRHDRAALIARESRIFPGSADRHDARRAGLELKPHQRLQRLDVDRPVFTQRVTMAVKRPVSCFLVSGIEGISPGIPIGTIIDYTDCINTIVQNLYYQTIWVVDNRISHPHVADQVQPLLGSP
jgi:hypothetical protein